MRLRPGRAGDDLSWAEYWNRSKVLGYIGACHMRMRRPEAARATSEPMAPQPTMPTFMQGGESGRGVKRGGPQAESRSPRR